MLKCVFLSFCGQILWTSPRRGALHAHVHSSVYKAANLRSLHVIFPLSKQVLYYKKTLTATLYSDETMAPYTF